MKILDLGCGALNNKYKIYNSNNQTTGIDIDKKSIEECKEKFPNQSFVLVDGKTLPFENESFDMIHSLDVLEHVDDLEGVISEATRVLKKGGIFIIEVPYWKSEERLLKLNVGYWKVLHHVRMFKKNDMKNLMEKFGYFLHKSYGLKFFENITLGYSLKRGNLKNQQGEVEIKAPFLLTLLGYFFIKEAALFSWKSKIIIYPFYVIFSPIRWIGNYLFPKSIYFKFQKNT